MGKHVCQRNKYPGMRLKYR